MAGSAEEAAKWIASGLIEDLDGRVAEACGAGG
jgi:hypothetical protein